MGTIKKLYATAGMKLFRFMNPRSAHFQDAMEHLVCGNEVFLSSRKGFNDPFDMNPILICDWTISGIRRHMLNIAENPFRSAAGDEVIAQYLTLPKRSRIPAAMVQKFKDDFPVYMGRLLDRVGVCCFTEEMQNPIFWAHYANNYAGVCAQFVATNDISQPFCNCMKVHYAADRPIIRASQIGAMSTVYNNPDWDHIVQYGFCTKSSGWAVEKEWRFWLPLDAQRYQKLPPKTLRAMFLGPFADSTLIDFVKSLVKRSATEIKVFNTCLSPKEFAVNIGGRVC
jgi:hypothetical protein